MSDTLFGHLAARFTASPENLATEALAYILNGSEHARGAVRSLVTDLGLPSADDLMFRTQEWEEGTIPDLVGYDTSGEPVLVVESKFWAGLTDNQPNAYLRRLPPSGGVLVVLSPALRFETLWPTLLARVQSEHPAALEVPERGSEGLRLLPVDDTRSLVLLSWAGLLGRIRMACEEAGEQRTASDVAQLNGLADLMDRDAFMPLRSEELTSGLAGLRYEQYCNLVDDALVRLRDRGVADTEGLRLGAGSGYYGQFLRVAGWGGFLHFAPRLWARHWPTPIWFHVKDPDWKATPIVYEMGDSLARSWPGRVLRHTDRHGWDSIEIALELPTAAEYDQVVDAIVAQVEAIEAAITRATGNTADVGEDRK